MRDFSNYQKMCLFKGKRDDCDGYFTPVRGSIAKYCFPCRKRMFKVHVETSRYRQSLKRKGLN